MAMKVIIVSRSQDLQAFDRHALIPPSRILLSDKGLADDAVEQTFMYWFLSGRDLAA